ncbi:GntR family transcriptional regulator [Parasphingorhabdus pacifica]
MATDEDKRPASRHVAEALQGRISAGEFGPGDQLPTYRQLASEYDVAVNTALAAVRVLRDAGTVTIRPNAGAYVRDASEEVDIAAELNQARAELGELREAAQRFETNLGSLEGRIASLASRLDETQ